MRTNILLFTQTMHSLLVSSLPIQDALSVCIEVLSGKGERNLCRKILKNINEGKRLCDALLEYGSLFPSLYIPLVNIGEESGTLAEVFGKLKDYMKDRKNVRQKVSQALAYPILVLATAVIMVFVLLLFVMPRLEGIFEAFADSTGEIVQQTERIKSHFRAWAISLLFVGLISVLVMAVRTFSEKFAFIMDCLILKIPAVGKLVTTMQMHDLSFAMKVLVDVHFSFVESLKCAAQVLSNRRLKKSVLSASASISAGTSAGQSFENEREFPKYFVVWIKIAERNGNTAEAFRQIYGYYSAESGHILDGITAFVEPVFILITGAVITAVIGEFVFPVFTLLGAL